ncbi:hypothetical protein SynMVIR181_00884 [Synechococcus sp. MVIR-18-1]|nr:hypothetical protein SynMVIR181_00884 [Synechococcus sp. MVIR-18-1]
MIQKPIEFYCIKPSRQGHPTKISTNGIRFSSNNKLPRLSFSESQFHT